MVSNMQVVSFYLQQMHNVLCLFAVAMISVQLPAPAIRDIWHSVKSQPFQGQPDQ